MNLWSCLKEVKPLVFDGIRGMPLEAIQENWPSLLFDLNYMELFRVPAVNSGSL